MSIKLCYYRRTKRKRKFGCKGKKWLLLVHLLQFLVDFFVVPFFSFFSCEKRVAVYYYGA